MGDHGTYVAELTVTDADAQSATDQVTISTRNTAPNAHAGADQTVSLGATVILDASGSTDIAAVQNPAPPDPGPGPLPAGPPARTVH